MRCYNVKAKRLATDNQ